MQYNCHEIDALFYLKNDDISNHLPYQKPISFLEMSKQTESYEWTGERDSLLPTSVKGLPVAGRPFSVNSAPLSEVSSCYNMHRCAGHAVRWNSCQAEGW